MTSKESDRELLTLAAKAAGIEFYSYVDSEIFGSGINTGELDVPLWNPLLSDGDAFRLAVKLRLNLVFTMDNYATALHGNTICRDEKLGWNMDDDSAARRSIVRAAAAIGKEK